MNYLDHTYAVILAGGGGTRLWPKSRQKTPKQFLRLTGKKTMLQVTADRISKLIPWERIIVVTNQLHAERVQKELDQIPSTNIIAEPQKRDTALAMLVGALYAKRHDPEAVVINCASDHVVTDVSEFLRVMKAAAKTAFESNFLVTVGIAPTRPASSFGYIKIGEDLAKLDRGLSLFKVESFTEKPNQATARGFISTGKYFWNANMYVWSADSLIKAFKLHSPKLYQQTKDLTELDKKAFHSKLAKIYDQVETISIDYAISEKADNLVLIPGEFGWDDVGDWRVVYELKAKSARENVVVGDGGQPQTLTVNSQGNLIHGNGRLIALAGVDDFIVVDTDEILMIVPKQQSQDVKKLVEKLKSENRKEYL